MKRLLICAAIPRESKYIRRALSFKEVLNRAPGRSFIAQTAYSDITLLQTGIGIHNAELSIGPVLKELRPDLVLSLGFGGALHDGLAAGEIVMASRIIFLRSGSSGASASETADIFLDESSITDFLGRSIPLREGCMVTLEHPMTKSEIRNILPGGIPYPVCDMETFALAVAARQRRIPFFAARAISDTSRQEVPKEFFGLIDASGKTSAGRLLTAVFKRPMLVKNLLRLGLNSEKAARSLGDLVRSVVDNAETLVSLCSESEVPLNKQH